MNTRTTIGSFCLAMAARLPSLPVSAAVDKFVKKGGALFRTRRIGSASGGN
ncbi:MAG: hypothetical protein HN759_11625 [Akkermansiaceae bacterium]|nr:hypothetical protein [Akkermansiaceae bacterium]